MLLFGFWTYALATLAYALDRNALIISWGPTQQVIPLGAIERLVPGTAVGVPPIRGVAWWGCHVGRARIDRVGSVLFYSAHQTPEEVLYVMTPQQSYAVSVGDPSEFARQIVRRQELGPTTELEHHVRRSGFGLLSLWEDPRGLAIAGVANRGGRPRLAAQLGVRYGSVPETIPLHFPASDPPPLVEVVERSALFELPQTATAILLVGLVFGALVHRRERRWRATSSSRARPWCRRSSSSPPPSRSTEQPPA